MRLVWLALLASTSAWADLASEKITGTVVYGGQLYPTKATALAAPANQKDRFGDAVTVLRDHGVTYAPKAGPVTWPDGTPAGKFLGGRYLEYSDDEVKEIKGRYCVQVGAVMERVCHAKSNVSVRQ